jgi:hypothetical protein
MLRTQLSSGTDTIGEHFEVAVPRDPYHTRTHTLVKLRRELELLHAYYKQRIHIVC